MTNFFSCDWGTTAFRLRLINAGDLSVIAEIKNSHGCAVTNEDWLKQNRNEHERYDYYTRIIAGYIQEIKQQIPIITDHIPLVISGMASSTVGMVNLPYKHVPFLASGSDLITKVVEETEGFPRRTILISGVKTADDAMRGEETKLIGCLDDNNQTDKIIVLPGTHPKHAYIKQNQIVSFKTYMTGEFFELLSQKSLLALSVNLNSDFDQSAFENGVKEGASGHNLLHSSFLVRTNLLFEKYTAEQNFNYLSGMLLGSELKDLIGHRGPVILLGSGKLGDLYQKAFATLGITLDQIINGDEALIKGQSKMLL